VESSNRQAISAAFARSIFAKSQLLESTDLTLRERARVREAIAGDIRKFTDLRAPEASDAALALAKTLDVDIRRFGWHHQYQFDRGRKQFLLEHVLPVGEIRDRCCAAASEEEVAECLAEARVAWILRSEDETLRRLGYRTKRPDPAKAYSDAGISLAGLTDERPVPSADSA
jgi:hypothetical protein